MNRSSVVRIIVIVAIVAGLLVAFRMLRGASAKLPPKPE